VTGEPPDAELVVDLPAPLDVPRTLASLAHGSRDPTVQLGPSGGWLTQRTADGPATLHLTLRGTAVLARAWGTGSAAALDTVPALVGCLDRPEDLVPRDRLIADLQRRMAGVRLTSTGRPFDALLPAIIEQKVTGTEAHRAYRALVHTLGERGPGPGDLWLAPDPSILAGLPYHAYHPFGIERRRADTIRRAASIAHRLSTTTAATLGSALFRIRGIGPWTVAEVQRVAFGDPDAVSVGDYHLPSLVAWALAGEARADDARMLELLEPYRGQRGRVQRLLELSGISAPRFGPRLAPRQIRAI
jgi:3-methyladenine DNA glycosylase/8-oxoguanine DNA glycosylase